MHLYTGLLGNAPSSIATVATIAAVPSRGLGGVDPKNSTALLKGSSNGSKVGENKMAKESQVPAPICQTVDNFQ